MSAPGKVVTIRINPSDCIACVDLMDKVGVSTEGKSFDVIVRMALSILLASAQEANMLRKSSGFDFDEKVNQRFPKGNAYKVPRIDFTKHLNKEETSEHHSKPTIPQAFGDRRVQSLLREQKELTFQLNAAPESFTKEQSGRLADIDQELTELGHTINSVS